MYILVYVTLTDERRDVTGRKYREKAIPMIFSIRRKLLGRELVQPILAVAQSN